MCCLQIPPQLPGRSALSHGAGDCGECSWQMQAIAAAQKCLPRDETGELGLGREALDELALEVDGVVMEGLACIGAGWAGRLNAPVDGWALRG